MAPRCCSAWATIARSGASSGPPALLESTGMPIKLNSHQGNPGKKTVQWSSGMALNQRHPKIWESSPKSSVWSQEKTTSRGPKVPGFRWMETRRRTRSRFVRHRPPQALSLCLSKVQPLPLSQEFPLGSHWLLHHLYSISSISDPISTCPVCRWSHICI